MPLPSLDLDELARRFDDSPPPEDEIGCESALVPAVTQVTSDAAPLEGGDPPEGSGPLVEGPTEGEQEVALVEEESTQLGTGTSGEMEEEGQT
ncbi:unnamed protein product [Cochlearia groenlandica]